MQKSYYNFKWLSLLANNNNNNKKIGFLLLLLLFLLVSNLLRRKLVLTKRLLTQDYFRKAVYTILFPFYTFYSCPFSISLICEGIVQCSVLCMQRKAKESTKENIYCNEHFSVLLRLLRSSWPWVFFMLMFMFQSVVSPSSVCTFSLLIRMNTPFVVGVALASLTTLDCK